MPRDTSIHKILLIGSGPIVIGQGCEFDYSGVQACKALKEEGYEVVLVNSNPATIMTDPEFADRTYIEPITPEIVEKIIIKEKPDALLPTLGGQTALNTAMALFKSGVLEKHHVRMIGAKAEAIEKGEDRLLFKNAMLKIGLDLPQSGVAHTIEEARRIAGEIGTLPLIIRPAYTLGGTGGGIAYNKEEFETITARGLDLSPVCEVLIEESLLGWKEFEMEVMRDRADNCVIICSIENLDPMGVHTGDSITVAPIQTLTDREYQIMRDASFACIREIGVETGGSNIQFAMHPETGRMIVIEMNPRVSRSSALASKATGFPIAKIAAKLAVGCTLDELKNDITRETPASFEPTIDYVVTKVPRFTFEKFPGADETLTTQMKSVGEAMAIGRTFKESLQKALRSLEIKRFGLIGDGADKEVDDETLTTKLSIPNAERIFFLGQAFARGWSVDRVFDLTKIDRWFLRQIEELSKADVSSALSSGLPVRSKRRDASPSDRAEHSSALPPVFKPFDEGAETTVYTRRLPHWRQDGSTYAVTFRLADSIPASALEEWKLEEAAWKKHHAEPWNAKTWVEYHTRFTDEKEKWLDQGHGECILRQPSAQKLMEAALRFFDRQRYHLDYFAIMPNHVHVIVQPLPGFNLTDDILKSWKQHAAKEINKALNRTGAVWMEESCDRIIRDDAELAYTRKYIARNPTEAKLCTGEFVLGAEERLHCRTEVPSAPSDRLAARPPERTESPSDRADDTSPLRRAKRLGFSDRQLAIASNVSESIIRAHRKALGIIPTYRLVDTCAAEFEAFTPYYYSTYGIEDEVRDNDRKKVMILGGGPNRIGQGIEFDYCCVHASFALRELGFETIMVNSNPETVSTDYDTSDKLYFEPLTLEDVLNIYERENRHDQVLGVVVQFGGQTPLNLARGLEENGVRIIGTSPKSIELAEDRKLFAKLLDDLGLNQASSGTATSLEEALAVTARIGYPSLVRPSFVLGGRGMQIVYTDNELITYVSKAISDSKADVPSALSSGLPVRPERAGSPPDKAEHNSALHSRPILIDRFLEDATEVDVDCISDGETTVIGAIMEHIEEAGIHSGDSACVIPPFSLSAAMQDRIRDAARKLAEALNVRGLMNMQLAVKGDDLYVIEVNPRASRTAPFVSKAIGVPLPKLAAKIMCGMTLKQLGFTKEVRPKHYSVKEAVFPFSKFQGVDIILGPEMKSTGEVMGIDMDFGMAFAKSQMAVGATLPTTGNVFISVKETDRPNVVRIAKGYADLGFTIYATSGTGGVIADAGIPVNILPKLASGQRPNVIDLMKNKDMALVINTPSGKNPREDEVKIRTAAMQNRIPIMTTLRGADATLKGIKSLQGSEVGVRALQEYHEVQGNPAPPTARS